jgi:hypothetical protein
VHLWLVGIGRRRLHAGSAPTVDRQLSLAFTRGAFLRRPIFRPVIRPPKIPAHILPPPTPFRVRPLNPQFPGQIAPAPRRPPLHPRPRTPPQLPIVHRTPHAHPPTPPKLPPIHPPPHHRPPPAHHLHPHPNAQPTARPHRCHPFQNVTHELWDRQILPTPPFPSHNYPKRPKQYGTIFPTHPFPF